MSSVYKNNFTFSLPIWIPFNVYLFFLLWLLWLGLPILRWIEEVRVDILALFQILVERLSTFHHYIHFALVQCSTFSIHNPDYIRVQLYQLVIFTNSTAFKFGVFPGFFTNSQAVTFISSAFLKDNFPMWPFLTLHWASHRTFCKFTPNNSLLPRAKCSFLKKLSESQRQ